MALAPLLWALLSSHTFALQDTNYTSEADDRFTSGYPSAPIANTDASFIGLGYDFSGVGWSATDPTKSFGLLSPRHYLVARHYGGASTIDFLGGDGDVHSYTQQSVQDTNYGLVFSGQTVGDIALGTLTTSIASSDQVQSFAILDLGSTGSNYTNQSVLLYGHGPSGTSSPRLGSTTIYTVGTGSTSSAPDSYFATFQTQVQLEGGDSGSPGFIPWTDPSGTEQLTIIGNNAAISSSGTNSYNILNFIARTETAAAINALMVDEGYALRFVADPTSTWKGGSGATTSQRTSYTRSGNWSTNFAPTSASYLAFNSSTTTYLSVDLQGGTQSARGLIFKSGTASFTLSNGTLSLGRGGINNYDTHAQTLSNGITLSDHQYWDGGTGGLNITGAINTNGNLVIVQGSGANSLSGIVSGSGSLAKDGSGRLTITGANTYSGATFLHNGTLVANNTSGSATGTGAVTVEAGTLAGFGLISGNTSIAVGAHLTAGDISTENSPTLDTATQGKNILTFGGNLTLNGAFDFYLGNLSELSGYSQLILNSQSAQLTLGSTASFTLSSSTFTGISDPDSGLAFWNSAHTWILIDVAGSTQISGSFTDLDLGNWSQGSFSLAVNSGSGNDVLLNYNPVPEPSTWALFTCGLVLAGFHKRWKV